MRDGQRKRNREQLEGGQYILGGRMCIPRRDFHVSLLFWNFSATYRTAGQQDADMENMQMR